MLTTYNVDEILDAVLERIEIGGVHRDEFYPRLSMSDRIDLIAIIKEIASP